MALRDRITVILQEDYETAEEWTCNHCQTVNPIKRQPCDCGASLHLDNTKRWWASMKERGCVSPDLTLEQFDEKHGGNDRTAVYVE